MYKTLSATALLAQLSCALISEAPYFYNSERPLIIAHRGSYGHAPEHSMASYMDAYYGGADFLELDVEVSSDGYLILQHDPTLNDTTNIYEYGGRTAFKNKQQPNEDWLVADFSLAELKMLKRYQRYADIRSPMLNDRYDIVTLTELIENVQMINEDEPRTMNADTKVGLYIEIKEYAENLKKG